MPDYAWELITERAPFAPRDGAGAIVFEDAMWLIGGWNPDDAEHFPSICTNDVWRSTDGLDWQCVKPNTFGTPDFDTASDWSGRHTAGYVVHDGQMWIVGGDPIQGVYQDDVWSSRDGVTWQRALKNAPWGPRVLHYAVAHDGYIWLMGGQTLPPYAPAPEVFYDDIWRSADGANWEQVQPVGRRWPQRGMIGASAVWRDRMWLMGGGTYDTPNRPKRLFYNDVWSSADGVSWQCHTTAAAWAGRQYHEVAVFDDRLWVLEGYGGANRNDVWWSADGSTWHEVPDTPWAVRHAASVFVYRDALWMVAGNNMTSDVWRLTRS